MNHSIAKRRVIHFLRLCAAFALGAALPHAIDALLRSSFGSATASILPTASAAVRHGVQLALASALVGLPAAWLTARLAANHVRSCTVTAVVGGLAALAAPFVGYALPVGTGTLQVLWPHLLLLGLFWPAAILAFSRSR